MSTNAPSYDPSSAKEDSDLIDSLVQLSQKSPKLVKGTEAAVPGCEEITVRSWKMNEFKYYDIPSPFPTLARGLFTTETRTDGEEEEEVKHRIVWEALKEHTAAPYVLSLKSNGCIIFIAAITPTKLIVTSKHSVGTGDETVSHALMGRKWLTMYLEQRERTEADMAAVLWKNRWTAVAELCDDSFEEHVLPYAPEKTGLHLHGINVSTKSFQTLPTSAVDAFADEWGFIKTATLVLPTIEEVQSFTSEAGETGAWNGEAVEGFVVRTHVTEPPTEQKTGGAGTTHLSTNLSPYKPGSSFFFKVKFDEPYMMYRDWREVTRSLLSIKAKGGTMSASALPKKKMKRAETQAYVQWVIEDIERNPELFSEYAKGKGIIATRERYLKYLEENGGVGEAAAETVEEAVEMGDTREFGKTVIAPVAIPGCALAYLFGWGHTQSDNIQVKKAAPMFIKNVVNLVHDYDVVIADKNNHLKQHRQSLRSALAEFPQSSLPIRLIALNWDVHSHPPALVHRMCSERIRNRGARHQTLIPDLIGAKSYHEEVIWKFLNEAEELSRDEVDYIVEMDVLEDTVSRETMEDVEEPESGMLRQIRKAVEGVCAILEMDVPSDERLRGAVEHVRRYEDELGLRSSSKSTKYATGSSNSGSGKKNKKSAVRPHVTLVHQNQLKDLPPEGRGTRNAKALWDACTEVHELENSPQFEGRLGWLVWNERVMAVTFDDVGLSTPPLPDDDRNDEHEHEPASTKVLSLINDDKALKSRLHVTIGTRDWSVPPVEAKTLVEEWRRRGEKEGLDVEAERKIWAVRLGGGGVKGVYDRRKENEKLREERNDVRAEIEELRRQVETLRKAVREIGDKSASPGPTETKFAGSPCDGIITQSLPVPTRRVGKGDIVGFGLNGVTILRTSLMPRTTKLAVPDFGYIAGGWRTDKHVRLVGDTTGDGLSDIIGFTHGDFGLISGWSVGKHIRYVVDLRKKGYVDIIGFGDEGVLVSLNNGDGTYAPPRLVLNDFGFNAGGWRLDRHLRFLADVNGDGIPDIVAFGEKRVFVALGNGDGTFAAPRTVLDRDFTYSGFGWRVDVHPRTLGDLTGDGRADIIGFANAGVYVALNNGDGTFQKHKLVVKDFGAVAGGWRVEKHPRFVADVNGDGRGDIVGFGDAGVYVAIGNGDGTFQAPKLVISNFGYNAGGWRVDKHPRFVVDLTGDGAADIIGFGQDAVWVSYNDGKGNFGYVQQFTEEFSYNRGWGTSNTVRWIANL
ncbi:hypothetical protein H1R20_g11912, partial [Candolleomyces eurysporus]